ncbi:mannosyltransferase [Madurella fahalii]|uniref:Mannosyltransferase n=1 Tax=Madurella fahalii TaxID=1157608 RepID=A0ABQ0GNW9_9PEZI
MAPKSAQWAPKAVPKGAEETGKGEFVHPSAKHARKKAIKNTFAIEPISAFYIFLAANAVAALFSPIQDCDETFNYWEPTHYLSHGYGLQTWEYSPDYAIRSWLYIAIHAVGANIRRLLPHSSKVAEFYFLRYILAFVCALCQTLMWRAVCLALNPRVGLFFILALVFSPGNFHSSTAYLPSSFAMYMAMVGAAAFMNWRGGIKTSQGMFWFAVGGVLGWPFAAALCAPFVLEEAFFAMLSDRERFFESFIRLSRGVIAALLLVVFDTAINTFFYKKVEIVSWNIIKYNIFSVTGGPDLYGTEPWTFYFKNLLLNFNAWFILALLSLPLFLVQKIFSRRAAGETFQSGLRTLVFLTPFYMWLAIFSLQPHKEERFMYPAYPFLALNAALALHTLLTFFGNADPKALVGRIPAKLKLAMVGLAIASSIDIGLARIWGLYAGYHAPLSVYSPLSDPEVAGPGDTVCFGKDWYRFPSSFFLPRDMRAKFVRSEFRGLLPGEFSEARTGFGFWSGTWLPTIGLNDRNEEDPGKYVDLKGCVFLVDSQFPDREGQLPPNEPDYAKDVERWEEVKCVPFLDAERTHFLARALWIPSWHVVPERFRRRWGRHCLLKQKRK